MFQEANACDGEIKDLRDGQLDLSSQLENKQISVQQMQSKSDTMDGDIERLLELKQKVFAIQLIPTLWTTCISVGEPGVQKSVQ